MFLIQSASQLNRNKLDNLLIEIALEISILEMYANLLLFISAISFAMLMAAEPCRKKTWKEIPTDFVVAQRQRVLCV